MSHSSIRPTRRSRWNRTMGKLEVCQECQEQVIAGAEDEQTEEINPVTPIRNVKLPSVAEIEEHNLTHVPFRDWCEFCVEGKASSHPHTKRKVTENEVPVISMDYMVETEETRRRTSANYRDY